jgi:carboxymethylenebutenolidase
MIREHGWIQLGDIPAYRAQPAAGGPFPIVLVVQEIFGVHPHIQDICRRLAALGYLAIAPELYARKGDVSTITDHDEIRARVVSKVPDTQVMSDLDGAVAWAEGNGAGDARRLAITGFCWGGRTTWLYAAHSTRLKAAAAWYGRLDQAPTELQPLNPLMVAHELKCPVLGLYGGKDASIPVTLVDRMRAESGQEVIVYPEAGHGFFADYRPSYNPSAAQDAWSRMLEFFKKHGV